MRTSLVDSKAYKKETGGDFTQRWRHSQGAVHGEAYHHYACVCNGIICILINLLMSVIDRVAQLLSDPLNNSCSKLHI